MSTHLYRVCPLKCIEFRVETMINLSSGQICCGSHFHINLNLSLLQGWLSADWSTSVTAAPSSRTSRPAGRVPYAADRCPIDKILHTSCSSSFHPRAPPGQEVRHQFVKGVPLGRGTLISGEQKFDFITKIKPEDTLEAQQHIFIYLPTAEQCSMQRKIAWVIGTFCLKRTYIIESKML